MSLIDQDDPGLQLAKTVPGHLIADPPLQDGGSGVEALYPSRLSERVHTRSGEVVPRGWQSAKDMTGVTRGVAAQELSRRLLPVAS